MFGSAAHWIKYLDDCARFESFCIIVTTADNLQFVLQGGEVPATATLISNEAEFGHGFTIAGCALIHLLGQRNTFEVLDFASYVLQLDAHEARLKTGKQGLHVFHFVNDDVLFAVAYLYSSQFLCIFLHLTRMYIRCFAGSTTAAPAANLQASLVQETRSFVGAAQTQQLLQKQLFALFEVLHHTRYGRVHA